MKINSCQIERNTTMRLLQPPSWIRPRGYANGVAVKGHTIFLSGMVGWDSQGKFVSNDFVGQVRQTLMNIIELLAEANAKPEHIVRMNWYVVDKDEYIAAFKDLGVIYRELIGNHYPAMTAVQVMAFIEEDARVEIEVTAVVPD
jgi:enamine deaminase RidA (YjgF/YER057c/UK114 family)